MAPVEKPRSLTLVEKPRSTAPPLRPQAFLSPLSGPRFERAITVAILPIVVIVLATFVIPWLSSEFSLDNPKPPRLTMLDGEATPLAEEVAPIVDRAASEERAESSSESVSPATQNMSPPQAVPGENAGAAKDWYHDAEFTVPAPRLISDVPVHSSKSKQHSKKQTGRLAQAPAKRPSL